MIPNPKVRNYANSDRIIINKKALNKLSNILWFHLVCSKDGYGLIELH
jgi:hypothetical protein